MIRGGGNEGYDFASDLETRAQRIAARQGNPDFEECEFDGYVMDLKIRPGGDLELRLGVPKSSKWDALKLSDASGIMVSFHCVRRYRGDGSRQLAGKTGDQQPRDADNGEGSATDDEAFVHDPRRADLIRHMRESFGRE